MIEGRVNLLPRLGLHPGRWAPGQQHRLRRIRERRAERLFSADDVDLRTLHDGELLERLAMAFRSNLSLSVRDSAAELNRRARERRDQADASASL
jgi:hypothetical protein